MQISIWHQGHSRQTFRPLESWTLVDFLRSMSIPMYVNLTKRYQEVQSPSTSWRKQPLKPTDRDCVRLAVSQRVPRTKKPWASCCSTREQFVRTFRFKDLLWLTCLLVSCVAAKKLNQTFNTAYNQTCSEVSTLYYMYTNARILTSSWTCEWTIATNGWTN